jgi:hypothetical protein
MAKRRALDRLRRRLAYRRATDRLEIQMVAEFNDKIGRPQVRPTTFDLSELLSTMIRLLPEPQQEVVELTFFKGLTQREIGEKKIYCAGHSEDPVTPGSKETVESIGANSEQNLTSLTPAGYTRRRGWRAVLRLRLVHAFHLVAKSLQLGLESHGLRANLGV